jgi:hypothetical protein
MVKRVSDENNSTFKLFVSHGDSIENVDKVEVLVEMVGSSKKLVILAREADAIVFSNHERTACG